jgi:hypothetical protein
VYACAHVCVLYVYLHVCVFLCVYVCDLQQKGQSHHPVCCHVFFPCDQGG